MAIHNVDDGRAGDVALFTVLLSSELIKNLIEVTMYSNAMSLLIPFIHSGSLLDDIDILQL